MLLFAFLFLKFGFAIKFDLFRLSDLYKLRMENKGRINFIRIIYQYMNITQPSFHKREYQKPRSQDLASTTP